MNAAYFSAMWRRRLPRAGDLRVVGVKVLGEQEKPADPRRRRQSRVGLRDLLADQRADLGLLGEVRVARVRQPAALGPAADRPEVDRDHRGHERPPVADRHRLPDVRAELELILDELGRERRAVDEGAHVLGAVDDDEVPAGVEEARVARAEPPSASTTSRVAASAL